MAETSLPVERVEAAYRNWRDTKGQSAQGFVELMADDIEMRSVLDPALPDDLAADRRSIADARQYFDVIARDWEMIDYPQDRIVAEGDTVVWIGRCAWRNRHTGQAIDTPKVDIWTFREGKAIRFFEIFDSLSFARTAGLM